MADDQQPDDDQQPEAGDAGSLSQDEVDAMLGSSAAAEPAAGEAPTAETGVEGDDGGALSQGEIDALIGGGDETPADDEAPAAEDEAEDSAEPEPPLLDDDVLNRLLGETGGGGSPAAPPSSGQQLDVDDDELDNDRKQTRFGGAAQEASSPTPIRDARSESVRQLDLLADVVLTVCAEIGRSEMTIEDVLKLGPGSLIELDKLAGEPVELLVNDRCIARGEVVVVDDSFGIRITELGE